jgi:hypothetical protein
MIDLADVKMFARLASKLPRILRRRISVEEARAIVRRRLAQREANFLRLVERGIYANGRSPYVPLLKQAGCDLGDLTVMVRDRGLEEALRALRSEGVYITFEEFKGRVPIVRNGAVLQAQPQDFHNPFSSRHYEVETGGSTGVGTRIPHDLDHLAATAPFHVLTYDTHGLLTAPMGLWQGVLPSGAGINNVLRSGLVGNVPRKWFSPVLGEDLQPALRNRLATAYVIATARLMGLPVPWPRSVRLDEVAIVARWAHDTAHAHGACVIRTPVSMALRVAVAADTEGFDLRGVTFMGGGEPPTPAKVRRITGNGARFVPHYGCTETGPIGMGCGHPLDGTDVHLFEDSLALIQHPQVVPGTELTVDAFCFTTLLPTAPRILLNVESDDYGEVETRSCGCPLEEVGYARHVRNVFSYRKLTGEGMTLIGSDMLRILDEVLPARFGGSPLDYQLLEEEDDLGFTRIAIVVSPTLVIEDEAAVVETVLEALRRGGPANDLARAIWSQAETLRVRRMAPILTGRGKLMPLQGGRRSPLPRATCVAG